MKLNWMFAALCAVALPVEAQIVLPYDEKPLPAQKAKNVSPELIEATCEAAVLREQTPIKRIRVLDVSVAPPKDENTAECVVSAAITEGAGVEMRNGPYTTTSVRYSGSVDVQTGKVTLTRIDAAAAEQVALNALAEMFINLQPTAMSSEKITYRATFGQKKCSIEVANNSAPGDHQWLVTKLECKP